MWKVVCSSSREVSLRCRGRKPRGVTRDLAVDIGTTKTLLFARGQGLVCEEPTVVAVDVRSGQVVDIGSSALVKVQSEPGRFEAIWPVRNGGVSDPVRLERFLGGILRPMRGGFFDRMRLVMAVPSRLGPTEHRVLNEVGKRSGATSVHLLPTAMAAALGADLPVHEPVGTMVIDAGGGSTEAALLTLGSIVAVESVRFGGLDVNEGIRSSLRRSWRIVVDDPAVEELKLAVASSGGSEFPLEAMGNAVSGGPMTAILEQDDIRQSLDGYFAAVEEVIRAELVQAPPELAQDVLVRGVHLVGGCAHSSGLANEITRTFGIPVDVPADPAHVIGLGVAKCLEAVDSLRDVFLAEYV